MAVPNRIRLDQLLLGKDYWNSHVKKPNERSMSFDYATELFGKDFQRRLREKLHKSNPKYMCPVCDGTGLLTNESDTNLTSFVNEVSELAKYEATQGSIDALKAAGMAPAGQKLHYSNSKGTVLTTYNATTPIFAEVLSRTSKLKARIRKINDELKSNEGLKKDPKKVLELTKSIIKNINDKYFGLFAACPICAGNGYFDIGHKSFAGKQAEVLILVFNRALKGRKHPNWSGTISKSVLEDIFMNLDVEPELPNTLSKSRVDSMVQSGKLKLEWISHLTTNRLIFKTSQAKAVKLGVYALVQEFYESGQFQTSSLITYEEVYELFKKIIFNVRVDTGTLKRKLEKQAETIKHQIGIAGAFTQDGKTPYPSKYIVIEGSTANEVVKNRRTRKNSLYVYANSWKKEWRKSGPPIDSYAGSIFGNRLSQLKINYFPQRVK